MLAGVTMALSMAGCGKNQTETSSNDIEEDTAKESTSEAASTEEDESSKEASDTTEDIVKLVEGENEYTDAVYEFGRKPGVLDEEEFATYFVDFDDNGKNEAFVLCGHQDETDDSRWYSSTVWFVDEQLKVDQIFGWYSPNSTYLIEQEFKDVDGQKCFYLSGYDVYDKENFCYMYMLKDNTIVDVTDDINKEDEVFESKYTQEELKAMTPQELFDAFCAGEIQAEFTDTDGQTVYFDTRDWGWSEDDMNDYQKVVDPYDLDNDGELEYIIDTLYGIMCFDCKDGKVVMFASGEDTATVCRYIIYDNATWIVYQDTLHEGRCTYQLYKFDGDLKIVDSLNLYWYEDDNGECTYYYNDEVISEDEYNSIYNKIFSE